MTAQTLSALLAELAEDTYEIRENVSFSELTSFRTGGNASVCLLPKTCEAFARALSVLNETKTPYLLLGHGTNVLAPDEGYDSVVLLTAALRRCEVQGNTLTLEAGVLMNAAACAAKDASLAGLEFAYGIPGSVGGALAMNAGAYDHEMKELPMQVTACDKNGRLMTLSGEECAFGYRESIFQAKGLVALACTLTLTPDSKEDIRARMEDYLARRKKSQPLEYPSAGSFFRRPTGYFAGKLIQDAGLKGARIGGAQISEKHAGFLINFDHATSKDIRALGRHVQNEVQKQFGVKLEREVKYLCDDDE